MAATILGFLRRAYYELIGYASALRRFRAISADAFGYLINEFGFEAMIFEETRYGALCRFKNPTTVVELHLDWTEEFIYIYVRPGPASEARAAISPPGVLLDAIMIHRRERPDKQVGVLKGPRMTRTLREYARALRADASDALRGDFRDLVLIRTARPEAAWRFLGPTRKQK